MDLSSEGLEATYRENIRRGRKWSALGTPSRTLGGGFTEQIHSRDRNENVRGPRREQRRQYATRADGFRQLEHQQHDERGSEAGRDAPRRAALGGRDGERRAEQRDQQTNEGNRDLEREIDLQLLRVRAAARQRVDVASQLRVPHLLRRLRLGEQIHRPLQQRPRLERIELERNFPGRLAA